MVKSTVKHSVFINRKKICSNTSCKTFALREIVPHDMLSFMIDIIFNTAQLMKTIIILY